MKTSLVAIGMCLMIAALVVPGMVSQATNVPVPGVAGNAQALVEVCYGEYEHGGYATDQWTHCKGTYVHV